MHKEITLPKVKNVNDHVFHIFLILSMRRDDLQHYLKEKGIETLIHYPIPPHKQKCYSEYNILSFTATEKIHREELSLPISPVVTHEEKESIVQALNTFD